MKEKKRKKTITKIITQNKQIKTCKLSRQGKNKKQADQTSTWSSKGNNSKQVDQTHTLSRQGNSTKPADQTST